MKKTRDVPIPLQPIVEIGEPYVKDSMNGSLPTTTYRYDVFVSYSQANSAWVWAWLRPRLKAAGLEFCIDRECFELGAPRIDEIERAINESRHVLIVLSPEWVDSEWNSFEGMLVQHTDPAARFRKLIPLLLKPCEPPERIQLLHWVDFTEAETRPAQLQRVTDTIQGIDTLPELRTDAYPHPQERRRELRWYTVGALSALMTLLVLLAWIYFFELPPTTMPDGNFNIAVAPFSAIDANEELKKIAIEQSESISEYLSSQADVIEPFVAEKVEVWGPDKKVPFVMSGEESTLAGKLNADLLLYGTFQEISKRQWYFNPQFYLSDQVVRQADELRGQYVLGSPIEYIPNNPSSKRELNKKLEGRVGPVVDLLMGLSDYAQGNQKGYEKATEFFRKAIKDPKWRMADDKTALEILYLFLGNAYLKQSFYAEKDPNTRTELLNKSKDAYKIAIDLNINYARSHNGLGSVYYQISRPLISSEGTISCDWQWKELGLAKEAFETAWNAPSDDKPPSGDVDLRARLGLGEIYLTTGFCEKRKDWKKAKEHYDFVVTKYKADPKSHLHLAAAKAYTHLGFMSLWQATETTSNQKNKLAEAIEYYEHAQKLVDQSNVGIGESEFLEKDIQLYLSIAYCVNEQTEISATVWNECVPKPSPTDSTPLPTNTPIATKIPTTATTPTTSTESAGATPTLDETRPPEPSPTDSTPLPTNIPTTTKTPITPTTPTISIGSAGATPTLDQTLPPEPSPTGSTPLPTNIPIATKTPTTPITPTTGATPTLDQTRPPEPSLTNSPTPLPSKTAIATKTPTTPITPTTTTRSVGWNNTTSPHIPIGLPQTIAIVGTGASGGATGGFCGERNERWILSAYPLNIIHSNKKIVDIGMFGNSIALEQCQGVPNQNAIFSLIRPDQQSITLTKSIDQKGYPRAYYNLPYNSPTGTYTILAEGDSGTFSQEFTVINSGQIEFENLIDNGPFRSAIYEPNQTIKVHYRFPPGQQVEVGLYIYFNQRGSVYPEGTLIDTWQITVNERGQYSEELSLPSNVPLGNYYLTACTVGNCNSLLIYPDKSMINLKHRKFMRFRIEASKWWTPTPAPTETQTATPLPPAPVTTTPTLTVTATASALPPTTVTMTPTLTVTGTVTALPPAPATVTTTPTLTVTATVTALPPATVTTTPTLTVTATASPVPPATATTTPMLTVTATATVLPPAPATVTTAPTLTVTQTFTPLPLDQEIDDTQPDQSATALPVPGLSVTPSATTIQE